MIVQMDVATWEWLLRHLRSFKVTNFGTNRKLMRVPIYLLVINTNLPPILHRLLIIGQIFASGTECLTLTLFLLFTGDHKVIHCEYRYRHESALL